MMSDEWYNWVDEVSSKAEEMLAQGSKLQYIRLLRNLTGLDLKACKNMADAVQEDRRKAQMREAAKMVLRKELSESTYNYIEALIDG